MESQQALKAYEDMEYYITQPNDYWIAQNAVSISLNALNDNDRIQGSVASGAVISCYVKSIKSVAEGGPAENGDGLGLDNGRNPKRWPLSLSPTYFNSHTAKYVYVAIPRSVTIGTQAVIVFPSQLLDIYGREYVPDSSSSSSWASSSSDVSSTSSDGEPRQIGSTDYFYVYLQGIISSSGDNGETRREWVQENDYGSLGTYEDLITVKTESDWYSYANNVVTFLKEIVMSDDSRFRNLKATLAEITGRLNLGTGIFGGSLTGVATKANASQIAHQEKDNEHIVTPSFIDEFGNTRYLSKIHNDTAQGVITFLQGLKLGSTNSEYGFSPSGAGHLFSLIFDDVLKSLGASKGFNDGRGIYMDGHDGLIETDGLNVRGFMRVMELIINRLQLMESDYSFTEGDTVEHVDYEVVGGSPTGRLILTMKKDHSNDYTPFYPGDIIYGKVNDLLPKGATIPDGHIETKNGSYYTVWMKVRSVNLASNQLTVELYGGKKQDRSPMVPGGVNFTPYGTPLADFDVSTEVLDEYSSEVEVQVPVVIEPPVPASSSSGYGSSSSGSSSSSSSSDSTEEYPSWEESIEYRTTTRQLGLYGYDTMLTVTRYGNVADGIDYGNDNQTEEQAERLRASQLARQQSWHLSTTDQRLVYYWRVDEPIVGESNIALCLGMLPQILSGVVPSTIDWSKPSLYVSQIYYESADKIKYPARIVKVDRGEWTSEPSSEYIHATGGTWKPDGTYADHNGDQWIEGTSQGKKYGTQAEKYAAYCTDVDNEDGKHYFTVGEGDVIPEPYHNKTFTFLMWLYERLAANRPDSYTDGRIEAMMLCEWMNEVDLEVSRVWHGGKLWECLADCTTQEPKFGCSDWQVVGGDTAFTLKMLGSGDTVYEGAITMPAGETGKTIRGQVLWGKEDISDSVVTWRWDLIEAGGTVYLGVGSEREHTFDVDDLPEAWEQDGYVLIRCTAIGEGFSASATIRLENADARSYDVEFTDHVDVITVDDVGNVIGGLWKDSGTSRQYRIVSAINVRKNGTLLKLATHVDAGSSSLSGSSSSDGSGEVVASKGTYMIYYYPVGCQAVVEDSTIYITGIDNIKDGVAGTPDDANFDFEAMRRMESCRVDIVVDCEGKQSITKTFLITIKHDSQPYVGADITNEHSAVSWNTRMQTYIGLPITFDMKMWHNNEVLDIEDADANVSLLSATPGVTLVDVTDDDISSSSSSLSLPAIYYTKTIVTIDGHKQARMQLVDMDADIPLVTDIDVTCTALYSGISYERTLRHTVSKSTDTNVYSLLFIPDQIIINRNTSTLSSDSIVCTVVCDSSEDKHYNVPVSDFQTHKLALYYHKYYTDGTSDANETPYPMPSDSSSYSSSSSDSDSTVTGVSVDSSVSEVKFCLYGLTNGAVDRTILHDSESVPVIANGMDGKGAEYVFFRTETWDGSDEDKPTIYDASNDHTTDQGQTKSRAQQFQEANYCPYTSEEDYGDSEQRWTDEPQGTGENLPYEFYAQRKMVGGLWQPFGAVHPWNQYTTNGVSPYVLDLSNEQSFINCDEDGSVLDEQNGYEESKIMLFRDLVYAFDKFDIYYTPTNISCNGYYPRGDAPVAGQTETPVDGVTNIVGVKLTPQEIATAQTVGYYTLTPSHITESAATIAVTAISKESGLTLVATYKINKNIAGQNSLIYSLQPSLDVIHRGTDTQLVVEVKRTLGTTVKMLSTAEEMANEGLSLSYTNISGYTMSVPLIGSSSSSSSSDDGTPVIIAVYDFVGVGTWGKLILRKDNTVVDSERINMVADGDEGQGMEDVFVRTMANSAPTISNNNDYTDIATGITHSMTDDNFCPMTSAGRATAEPQGISSTWPYEWIAKRTKTAPHPSTGVREWNPYQGTMKLYNNWTDSVTASCDESQITVECDGEGVSVSDANKILTLGLIAGSGETATISSVGAGVQNDAGGRPNGVTITSHSQDSTIPVNQVKVTILEGTPRANFEGTLFGVVTGTIGSILYIRRIDIPITPYMKGSSPWVADLDNETDSVFTDDEGNISRQQAVSTGVSLYYGNSVTSREFTIEKVVRNGDETNKFTVSGQTKSNVTVAWAQSSSSSSSSDDGATGATLTVTYGVGAVISDNKDVFAITLKSTDNASIVRVCNFKIKATAGDKYDLVFTSERAIAYNTTTQQPASSNVAVKVVRTTIDGTSGTHNPPTGWSLIFCVPNPSGNGYIVAQDKNGDTGNKGRASTGIFATVNDTQREIRVVIAKLAQTTINGVTYELVDEDSVLDSETVFITRVENGESVNPNILVDTAWFKNSSKWFHLNGTNSGMHMGRTARYANPQGTSSTAGSYERIAEQIVHGSTVSKLTEDTWYTLSVYCKGSGTFRISMLQAGNYVESDYYADKQQGTASLGPTDDLAMVVTLTGEWERHSLTFKTKSALATTYSTYASFRLLTLSGNAYIAMPKLEIGQTATAYLPNEEDLIGTSPWVADLDNETDSIACGEDNKPIKAQTVTTNLTLFYGNTPTTPVITSIVRTYGNGSTTTWESSASIATNGVYPSWSGGALTIHYTTDAVITDKDVFTIQMRDQDSTVTSSLTFKVNSVKGGAVYNLVPGVSSVVYNGSSYSPSTLGCTYTKYDVKKGAFITPSGATIKYVVDGAADNTATALGNSPLVPGTTFTQNVTFLLFVGGDIVDRETVPVVSDGVNGNDGTSPIIAYAHNSSDSIFTNDADNPTKEQTVSTVVDLHEGDTPLAFTTAVAGYSRNTASNYITVNWGNYNSSTKDTSDTVTVTFGTSASVSSSMTFSIMLTGTASDGISVSRTCELTVKPTKNDKYELEITPKESIFYNTTKQAPASTTITAKIIRTSADGTQVQAAPADTNYHLLFCDLNNSVYPHGNISNASMGTFTTNNATMSGVIVAIAKITGSGYIDTTTILDSQKILISSFSDGAGTIYRRMYKSTNAATYTDTAPTTQTEETLQGNGWGWSTTPTQISTSARYRWMIERNSDDNGTTWTNWSTPVITEYLAEDGTSISIKGQAKGVIGYTGSLPVSPSNGDVYLMNNSDTWDIETRGGGSWVGSAASMGDGYLVDGHLWMKVRESSSSSSLTRWQDFGKIQADPTPIHWLVCSPTSINFRSDPTGSFSSNGTKTVTCEVWKRVGDEAPTVVTATNYRYDGYFLCRGLVFSDGKKQWWQEASRNITYENALGDESQNIKPIVGVEFALATSCPYLTEGNETGYVPQGIVATASCAITCDGRVGQNGAAGRLFYCMGYYDHTVEYQRTDEYIPLVFFDDGTKNDNASQGAYFYLHSSRTSNVDANSGTHYAPGAKDYRTNTDYSANYTSDVWVKATYYNVVITQGLFAEFAKLGKAIMSGDFMFSMNGKIGNTTYNAGAEVGDTHTPAYTWFKGDPSASYPIGKLNTSSSTSPTTLNSNIHLMKGMGISVKINLLSGHNTSYVGIKKQGENSYLAYQSWQESAVYTEKTITYTATEDMDIDIDLYGTQVSAYGSGTFSFSGVFEPNWWVDLLTGNMSAARGNFIVNPDGGVVMRNTLFADGVQSNTVDTQSVNGRRIHIEGGRMDVYNDVGTVGLSIGWDNAGDPFLTVAKVDASGQVSKAYKLTYDGVTQASASFTTDHFISQQLNTAGAQAKSVHNNTDVASYYKYSAARNTVTGAYSTDNPSGGTSSAIWQAARARQDGKWFTEQTLSTVIGNSGDNYRISNNYYIAANEAYNSSTGVYSRTLYSASDGVITQVGTVYYKTPDTGVGLWCDADGSNGVQSFDVRRYLTPYTRE